MGSCAAHRLGLDAQPKLTVRTGFGIYYDRGEFFSEFSPSAGFGFNGPLGVTLAAAVRHGRSSPAKGATLATPFGTSAFPAPPQTAAAFTALLPNLTIP